MRVLGLMSGTSLDGVDAAVIETDGERLTAFGPAATFAYTPDERAVLQHATARALAAPPDAAPSLDFTEAVAVITATHARAIEALVDVAGAVDLIGLHGQTVLHRPERRLTIQVGDAGELARRTGVPVVAELRQADLRLGGQGAPIVPVYHRALAAHLGLAAPIAFLNLGGVSNLTWIGEDGDVRAFDVGPGNGLIDQLVAANGMGEYDEGGRLAASGAVDAGVLAELMRHPYFLRPGPKSLDRYDFTLAAVTHLGVADAAATLAAFTAQAIAQAVELLPAPPQRWVLCGGGRHNRALVAELERRAGSCVSADELGVRGDVVEAEAMAYLAARSVRGLPITFPGTTGVARPATGGVRHEPGPTARRA